MGLRAATGRDEARVRCSAMQYDGWCGEMRIEEVALA